MSVVYHIRLFKTFFRLSSNSLLCPPNKMFPLHSNLYVLKILKIYLLLKKKFFSFLMINEGFFSVPGGSDGPSGVLICSENYITYKSVGDLHPDIRCPIPRRRVGIRATNKSFI